MSATPGFVETLPDPRRGQSVQLQRLGVVAAEELRKTVRTALTELFGNFLKQLPAALEQAARHTRNLAERRICQEMARSVPAGTPRWLDTFVQQVDGHLIGGVVLAARDRDGPAGSEDTIALANVELRAEALHQALLTELESKIDQIRQTLYVPVYSKALAPAGLCRALQDTADVLGWPAAQRGMLFKKFDELVVGELQQLYRSLLKALHEIDQAAAAAAAPDGAPARPPQQSAGQPESISSLARSMAAAAMQAGSGAPAKVDTKTLSMFQSYAQRTKGEGYHDGSLANDLLKLSANQPLPGMADEQRWVPLQRITLAGRFLNEAIADPFIPDELKSHHESMRFPMVKSALTDSTLFTSPTHPLSSLVNELLLKSATSRITGNAETRRMAELLEQVLVQFDLAPDFVRQAMTKAPPIDESQIQRFFELKRQEAQRRQETVIGEAKRLVIRELERATFGRGMPAPAIRFLNTAWGPLLVKRLLQYGSDHPQWKDALALMEQLLDRLDERQPEQAASVEWRELIQILSNALTAAGLAAERITEAFAQLEAARRTPL